MADQKTDPGPKTNAAVLKPPVQESSNPVRRLSAVIADKLPAFEQVATRYMSAERLVKLAQVAVSKKPEIADCTILSVVECLITCSRLGLEPNEPGGVWLVPFKGVCTPIIDYRGLIDVCRRSKEVLAVHADLRCENDRWEYAIDTTAQNMVTLKHTPADGDRGAIVGAFFVAKLAGGECQATYLSKPQIDEFRKRSKADQYGFSPWKTDYPAMAIKTVCRRGVNLMPRTGHTQALREEMVKEDELDLLPISEISEGSQDAIDRMIAAIGEEDKATSDGIVAAFKALDYGPAKQLQVLTRHHGQPAKELLDWLLNEQAKRAKPAGSGSTAVDTTTEPETPVETPVEEKPAAKKRGRPKGSGTKPAEKAATVTETVKQPAATSTAAKPKPDVDGVTF